MKRLCLILAFGVLLPATARAEPIAIVQSSSGGFSGGGAAGATLTIDFGSVWSDFRRAQCHNYDRVSSFPFFISEQRSAHRQ